MIDKSCPGSRTIREPRPEYLNCPDCGREVEIWTDELKATCSGCGGKVFRAQQVSCIDWCPHAKECVGPEVYERLKAGVMEDSSEEGTALDFFKREHDRALESISLLRAASLCLKLGALTPGSVVSERGLDHLGKVLDFIDTDVRLHFRREEEVLFPALEPHFGGGTSPVRLLLNEHEQVWLWYDQLREKLEILRGSGAQPSDAILAEVQDLSNRIEQLLREHIRKENESLVPLANGLLKEEELKAISQQWKSIGLETTGPANRAAGKV